MFMPHQTKQGQARTRRSLQIDLFVGERQKAIGAVPVWTGLPAEVQARLTALMTRLLLEHADKSATGSMTETGHDH
jgi:hypothetical protein